MNLFGIGFWLLYLLAAGLLLWLGWRLAVRWQPRWLRLIWLVLLTALLLTFWIAVPGQPQLAPALIIALYEGLFGEAGGFWRGALPILLVFFALLLLLGLYALVLKFMGHQAQAGPSTTTTTTKGPQRQNSSPSRALGPDSGADP